MESNQPAPLQQPEIDDALATSQQSLQAPATELEDADSTQQHSWSIYNLEPEQRQLHWKKLFVKQVEMLSHISEPDECRMYPEFKEEIMDAYLRWTTFAVRVWTNYDAAAKKFYIDKRTKTCGKLNLNAKARKHLQNIDPDGALELHRVRFEVGTLFTELVDIKLQTAPSIDEDGYVDISAKITRYNIHQPDAVIWLDKLTREWLDQVSLEANQEGMRVQDLEEIAKRFCRQASESVQEKLKEKEDVGPWMDLYGGPQPNEGFVDFDAMGKGCLNGCKGCEDEKWTLGSKWFQRSGRNGVRW